DPLTEAGTSPAFSCNMRSARWLLLALVIVEAACGSSSGTTGPTQPSRVDVTGTWSGNLTLQGTTARMIWTAVQTTDALSGSVVVVLPSGTVLLNGVLSGTVAGSAVTYTIGVNPGGIPTQPACTGRLAGAATVTNGATPTMAGSYSLVTSACATP